MKSLSCTCQTTDADHDGGCSVISMSFHATHFPVRDEGSQRVYISVPDPLPSSLDQLYSELGREGIVVGFSFGVVGCLSMLNGSLNAVYLMKIVYCYDI